MESGPEGGGGIALFQSSSCHGSAAQSITLRSEPVLAVAGFDQKLLTGPSRIIKTNKPTHNFLFILSHLTELTKFKMKNVELKMALLQRNSDLIPFPQKRQNKTGMGAWAGGSWLVLFSYLKENWKTKSVIRFGLHLVYLLTESNSGSAIAGRGNWI